MVTTGATYGDNIQILSPEFSENDRIIDEGNYGLSDTAKVKILTR